jgi:superfamily II DNA or RNA helicase
MINKNRVIERRVESRDPQRLDRRQLKEGTVGRKLQDARDFLKKAHEYRLMRMMKTEKYLAQELSQKLMRYNEMIRDPELDINQKAIVAEKMLNYISQIQLVQERMRDSTYSTIDGAIERINEKMLAHADNIASRDKLTQLKNEERFMHDVKQHIEDSKESIVFYIDVNNLRLLMILGVIMLEIHLLKLCLKL